MSDAVKPHSQPDSPDYSVGSIVFDRFKILGAIASGAKGRVYKAQDTLLQTIVALKVLISDHHNERDLVRFQSEARLASKMKHPGIATIFDFGIFGNTPFLSMEFVEGQSLEEYLEYRQSISIIELCDIFIQVCAAIDHAHVAGIVHRDIKPANIVISRNDDGSVRSKILDFGVAKNLDLVEEQGGKLTPTGNLVGSPNYMSPEQCRGDKNLTTKSDNYSLGCVMWKCLVAKPPFTSDSVMEVLALHVSAEPEKFSDVMDVPEKLASLIDDLLAKNPEDRPDLKTEVMPILNELREELKLSFRDPSDDNDTMDGAKNDRGLIEYMHDRIVYVSFGLILSILAVVGVFIYQDQSTVSEKLAPVRIQGTDVGRQTDLIANHGLENLIELVRQGRSRRINMSFVYDEKLLRECAGLPYLERLDMSDTPVSDSDTKLFAQIPNLSGLFLNRTRVVTLDDFEDLKKVRHLELKNTKITNQSLKNLTKMKALDQLVISNNDIDDDGIKLLTSIKSLNELDVAGTKITSKSAQYIKQFPLLAILTLDKTAISEAAIRDILLLPSLKFVKVRGCEAVDNAVLRQLEEDFPSISFNDRGALIPNLCRDVEKAIKKGNNKTAYRNIKKVIELSAKRFGTDTPAMATFNSTLSSVCLKLGKIDEAEQSAEKVVRYADKTQDIHFEIVALDGLAALADQRRDLKKLVELDEKLVKLEDRKSKSNSKVAISRVITLGSVYKESQDFSKSMRTFEAAGKRLKACENPDPDMVYTCQLQRAECLRYMKKQAEAESIFRKLKHDLESAAFVSNQTPLIEFSIYAGLAAIESDRGDLRSALNETDKMIALLESGKIPIRNQASLFRQRGEILSALGRIEESKKSFARFDEISADLSKSSGN